MIKRQLPSFLARAYHLKSVADYETGSTANITIADAAAAIVAAEQFVAVIRRVLSAPIGGATP